MIPDHASPFITINDDVLFRLLHKGMRVIISMW